MESPLNVSKPKGSKAMKAPSRQVTPQIHSAQVAGAEAVLQGSPFYDSYKEMRGTFIQANKLPQIGSLVSVIVENPHLNMVQGSEDSLVGTNIKFLHNGEFDVYPNTSSAQALLERSRNVWDREDADWSLDQDLEVEFYGQVFDYTYGVPTDDDKVGGDTLMVHIILNPFTATDGNYLKIGCIINGDNGYASQVSVIDMGGIVEAFRPAKSVF